MAGDVLQLVVGLQPIPVPLRHAPGGARVFLQRLEAFDLAFLCQVKPELEHQRALVDQHRLETVDLVGPGVQLLERHLVQNPLADRVGVPGAGKDADAPLGRQTAPVAPHGRALALLVGRQRERQRGNETRVHPFVQHVDGLALAGAILPADQHHHRNLLVLLQADLGLQQRCAQGGDGGLESRLVDLVANFCGFKHAASPVRVYGGWRFRARPGTCRWQRSAATWPPQ